ncbi:MAG: DUF308 domain-containing protein [Clostridia bacterium]|nr:DUF308 domain-containing protein [Clostridia bacterium]
MSIMKPFRLAWVQWLWVLSALVLLLGGVFIINEPDYRLAFLASRLGLIMLFAGLSNLVVYFRKNNEIHGSRWLLAEGLSTSLLALFPIFNEMVDTSIIPFFFGVWELFSGILEVVDAKELEEENIKIWYCFFAVGCAELLSGTAAMIEGVDHAVGINHVIAIIMFVQSCGFLFKIIAYSHLNINEVEK